MTLNHARLLPREYQDEQGLTRPAFAWRLRAERANRAFVAVKAAS